MGRSPGAVFEFMQRQRHSVVGYQAAVERIYHVHQYPGVPSASPHCEKDKDKGSHSEKRGTALFTSQDLEETVFCTLHVFLCFLLDPFFLFRMGYRDKRQLSDHRRYASHLAEKPEHPGRDPAKRNRHGSYGRRASQPFSGDHLGICQAGRHEASDQFKGKRCIITGKRGKSAREQ